MKKREADEVTAGTINGERSLRVEATGTGEQTKLSGIMRLVADAQKSKSRAQRLADRAAQLLTGIAFLAGIVTLIGWRARYSGGETEAQTSFIGRPVIPSSPRFGVDTSWLSGFPNAASLGRMGSHIRFLAAFCTLVALTLSFAEGVWASTCMPDMTAGAASQTEADCMMGDTMPAESSGSEIPEQPRAPQCPFGPLTAAGSCTVAALFPANPAPTLIPIPEGARPRLSFDETGDLLLVRTLFHPPRS